jgi:hypothetical protein
MRVLLLPANNAPEFQVKALEDIINKYDGHRIVRWSEGMSHDDFDFAIIIAGAHNEKNIRSLWNNYAPGEPLDMDDVSFENDSEVHIGKGLYSFINGTDNNLYLLMAPSEDSTEILHEFKNDHPSKGPAFLCFDNTDTGFLDSSDFKLRHGYIQVDSISDTTAYKYKDIVEQNGGYCIEKADVGSISGSTTTSPDIMDYETPLSLLLLRR